MGLMALALVAAGEEAGCDMLVETLSAIETKRPLQQQSQGAILAFKPRCCGLWASAAYLQALLDM
jgi:hypothetical protein